MDAAQGRAKKIEYDREYRQRPMSPEQRAEYLAKERERDQKRREDRAAKGLCSHCPNKPEPGNTRCQPCREHHRQRMNDYYRRKQDGKDAGSAKPQSSADARVRKALPTSISKGQEPLPDFPDSGGN